MIGNTSCIRSCTITIGFVTVLEVDHLPSHLSLPCGLVAGFLASTTTQPADVIKTRMQVQPESFSNITHTLVATVKEGGVRSLFIGLVPRATRRTLMASFTWAFYEHVSCVVIHFWRGYISRTGLWLQYRIISCIMTSHRSASSFTEDWMDIAPIVNLTPQRVVSLPSNINFGITIFFNTIILCCWCCHVALPVSISNSIMQAFPHSPPTVLAGLNCCNLQWTPETQLSCSLFSSNCNYYHHIYFHLVKDHWHSLTVNVSVVFFCSHRADIFVHWKF